MTIPEANSSNGCQTPPTQESKEDILDAYRIHFDVWKVQNDNYFRRVQILMMAIQAGLFAAGLKIFVDMDRSCFTTQILLLIIAGFGMASSCWWMRQNDRQSQYLEFCRRSLRNMEHKLTELGVPLRYFTLEAHVFGPPREEIPESAGTAVRKEEDRDVVEFTWARERYPDKNDDTKDERKRVHQLAKVVGGMKTFEKGMAMGILRVWFLILIVIIIAIIVRICHIAAGIVRICPIFK
jgi:hypothetical protein